MPWLRALAEFLTGMSMDAAQRIADGLQVRLLRIPVLDPWQSPLVGEGIPFHNTIWVKADRDNRITAVNVDDW